MIKDKKAAFALYVVLFILIWNIAEKLWLIFVDGNGYNITVGFHIATPLIVAVVTGYLFFVAKQVNINDELETARETTGAVIVDVRSEDEYAQGHIPGAINIPYENIESICKTVLDKDTPIYSYCLSGSRSSKAVKVLKTMGYTQAINMGGINKYKGRQEQDDRKGDIC